MLDVSYLINYLGPLQWFAAIVFVPLVCWQFCATQSALCRWSALLSAYGVQIGFFLLLDDVGFHTNLLILISSIAAYFWITTTVALWPQNRLSKPAPSEKAEKAVA
jgi:hypothetical protein